MSLGQLWILLNNSLHHKESSNSDQVHMPILRQDFSSSIVVSAAEALNGGGRGTWLGWRKERGWVLLDRTVGFNGAKITDYWYARASNYWYVQASDWNVYRESANGYIEGVDPCYYTKHLAALDVNLRAKKVDEILRICLEYRQVQPNVSQLIADVLAKESKTAAERIEYAARMIEEDRKAQEERRQAEEERKQLDERIAYRTVLQAQRHALKFPNFDASKSNQYQAGVDREGRYVYDPNSQPIDDNICVVWSVEKKRYEAYERKRLTDYVKLVLSEVEAKSLIDTYHAWFRVNGEHWIERNRDPVIQRRQGASLATERMASNAYSQRVTHCWRCKSHLDGATQNQCAYCGWIKCTCGACGCARM